MIRRFTALAILATTLAILWTRPADAHRGGGNAFADGMEAGPGIMLPMLLHNLDLTDAQRQQVHTILRAHRTKLQTLFSQLRDAQQDLDAKLLSAGPVQLADLTPQIQQLADLRKQVMQEGAAVALEVRGVLTPQQLARAAELHSQVAALRAQMRKLVGEPPLGASSD